MPASNGPSFDSIVFSAEGLRHLIAETGPGQVVIGTDYPFPWNRVPIDHILSAPGLSDDDCNSFC